MKQYLLIWMLLLASCTPSQKEGDQAEEVNYDCSNCGMPSNDFPQWMSQATVQGKKYYFCSPKCLVIRNMEGGLTELLLRDYYTQQSFPAAEAYVVIGSDVQGPMGPDFVPFMKKEDAEVFLKEHFGKELKPFGEVKKADVK